MTEKPDYSPPILQDSETDDVQKRYYSISEVAELLDVNPSVLRFWENEFKEISPKKARNGRRLYTERDLETLRIIHYLVKVRKFTLQGAREKLKMNPQDVIYTHQARETFIQIKKFLEALKSTL